ncbi:anti-sigma factor [Bacillus thuringiensis]|uniref:Anti-sigma factor n=1 Tax=Bacillus thuringiensis serovar andalousiensis TaxID=257985 RepID=A0A6H0T9U3_BACTU|nr:anti-sigma factor [Bacillus thuringiensis]QIW17921.1 anti-sigma factor [Bacillus thuringiensis serovar andalousiensis]
MTNDKPHSEQDDYKELLQEALHQRPASLSDGKQEQLLKIGKKRARITNVLIVFTFLLLIQPILYISTLLYYTLAPTNVMEIRNVVNQTLSVTEPNVFLKDRDMEQTLLPLSLQLHFDLYKRVGKKDIRIGEEKTDYVFSRATKVSREYTTDEKIPEIPYIDNEVLSHPNNYNASYNSSEEAQVLKGLPQESVVEAFVSFRELLSVQEVTNMFPTIDIVWYAVNTGLEEKQTNEEGMYVAPIGFPADMISSPSGAFISDLPHEEQFIDVLKSLQKHEDLAVKLSRAKVLELSKRISFLEKNGVKTYGAVVTGSKVEVEKLMSHEKVRKLKVGEARLWNWHS